MLDFYCSAQYKKLRQNAFYQKQRALDHLAKVVTGGRRDVVVAYGAGSFGSCVRGNPPIGAKAFLQRLRQRCPVYMVDEFRTSRVCCNLKCQDKLMQKTGQGDGVLRQKTGQGDGDLRQMTGHVWDRSQQPPVRERKQFWAVQTCNVCHTVWSRDRNASANIRNVFLSICETGERPPPFRRKQ